MLGGRRCLPELLKELYEGHFSLIDSFEACFEFTFFTTKNQPGIIQPFLVVAENLK